MVVTCRPIGVLKMEDEAGGDAKLLAVPIDKILPIYTHWQKPDDMNQLRLKQIQHFFEHYKDLEPGKWVKVEGWEGPESAKEEIRQGMASYRGRAYKKSWRRRRGRAYRALPFHCRSPHVDALCACGSLFSLLAAWRAAPSMAQALPAGMTSVRSVEGVDEYRLANGLQVLLIPDDSKPTTTVNLTYRVGSRHENYGETGMAHLLEHMLFKGTPKHRKVWAEFEKRGLAANGSTSFDRTNYTRSFSANDDNLQWYLGWLADAMVNSFIARKDLDTEMTVVRNEMEMGENSPDRILLQRDDGADVRLAQLRQRHDRRARRCRERRHPAPAGLLPPVLPARQRDADRLGQVRSGAVLAWVAQSFGKIPKPTRKLPTLYTLDPAQDGERSVTLRRTGGAPVLFAGYHVPAGAAPDYAAVDLLRVVLGDTPSGRLHKRLTEQAAGAEHIRFSRGAWATPGWSSSPAPGSRRGRTWTRRAPSCSPRSNR